MMDVENVGQSTSVAYARQLYEFATGEKPEATLRRGAQRALHGARRLGRRIARIEGSTSETSGGRHLLARYRPGEKRPAVESQRRHVAKSHAHARKSRNVEFVPLGGRGQRGRVKSIDTRWAKGARRRLRDIRRGVYVPRRVSYMKRLARLYL